MTEVLFYSTPSDRATTACRLLRKAVRAGSGVTVCLPAERLAAFDRLLWSFEPTEFIAHAVVPPGPSASLCSDDLLRRTPVWLVTEADGHTPHRVLLNLCDATCAGFASYERVIEVVSDEPQERTAGRQRWKHYQSRGYDIVHHKLAA